MITNIIKFSVARRSLILVLTLMLVIGGIFVARTIPIDAVPDITNTQVVIITKTGALSPEQIEFQVTNPLELGVMGVDNLVEVRSLS